MTSHSHPSTPHPAGIAACSAVVETLRARLPRLPVRDMLVTAVLVLSASGAAHADAHLQDWVPDVLEMPEDIEVVKDRAIGSSVRLLTISTEADVDSLFAEWQQSLQQNGYSIIQEDTELLDQSIEFSGEGITNAKIILSPTSDEDRSLIEFDATLN